MTFWGPTPGGIAPHVIDPDMPQPPTRGRRGRPVNHPEPPDDTGDQTDTTPKTRVTREIAVGYSARTLTAGALDGPVPVLYGSPEIGGDLFFVRTYGERVDGLPVEFLYAGYAFGVGPCRAGVNPRVRAAMRGDNPAEYNWATGGLGHPFYGGLSIHYYRGEAAPAAADAWYAARVGGNALQVERFPYLAHAFVKMRMQEGFFEEFPQILWKIDGLELLDPRLGLTNGLPNQPRVFSANPFLAIADYHVNFYGLDLGVEGVDWASVSDCANWSDETVGASQVTRITVTGLGTYASGETPAVTIAAPPQGGTQALAEVVMVDNSDGKSRVKAINITNPGNGYLAVPAVTIEQSPTYGGGSAATAVAALGEKRFELNMVLRRKALHSSYIDTLLAHCRGRRFLRSGKWTFYPDRPFAGQIFAFNDGNARIHRAARERQLNLPNRVGVAFPNEHSETDAIAWAQTAAVEAGTEDAREAEYTLEGNTRFGQAYRQAVYLLNDQLANLRSNWTGTKADCAQVEAGDVVSLSSTRAGLAAQLMRVLSVRKLPPNSNGYASFEGKMYDASILTNDALVIDDAAVSTQLPSPTFPPPPPEDLTLVEELYIPQSGQPRSRIKITWTPQAWPFSLRTIIRVQRQGGVQYVLGVFDGSGPAYIDPTDDLATYYVQAISRVASTGTTGPPATAQITAANKTLPPSNVPVLDASVDNGDVTLSWQQATDIDLVGYEVRYTKTDATGMNDAQLEALWKAAMFVDQVRALFYRHRPMVSSYTYLVKAVDSGGRYSAKAAWKRVDVVTNTLRRENGTWKLGVWRGYLPPPDPHGADYVKVSGNVIVERGVNPPNVTAGGTTAMLARVLSPTDVDNMMTAQGWTTLQQWDDYYGGLGLWAPLPIPAGGALVGEALDSGGGSIYGGSAYRNREGRFWMYDPSRIGDIDVPSAITRAVPLWDGKAGPTVYHGRGGMRTGVVFSVRLSTNHARAQSIATSPSGVPLGMWEAEFVPTMWERSTLVTDVNGLAARTYATPMEDATMYCRIYPEIANNVNNYVVAVRYSNDTGFGIRVVDQAGAVVSGVTVSCTAVDEGAGGVATEISI